MGTLTFVGLGLNDERGISLRGLEEAKKADLVFVELYTNYMPSLSLQNLERLINKPVKVLSRHDVEEYPERAILDLAANRNAVLFVPGDPMVATTHVDLRLRAEKRGVETRVICAASIQTAVCAMTGLQSYKFGRTITIPFPSPVPAESPYEYLGRNLRIGLHTLILLDLHTDRREYMTIREGIAHLNEAEQKRREGIFERTTLVIGIARAEADDSIVKAGPATQIGEWDFGGPPHCFVIPAELHFMEREALKALAGLNRDS